jgi:hypothetical protein
VDDLELTPVKPSIGIDKPIPVVTNTQTTNGYKEGPTKLQYFKTGCG